MKKTTWIDLTDILGWNGQHGGTQRVVYGIANQYYSQKIEIDEEVKFFAYDSTHNDFYQTDFEVIRHRVESSVRKSSSNDNLVSKKEKLKHYVIEYTPQFIRSNDKLRRGIFKVAKISYIQLNNAKKVIGQGKSNVGRTNRGNKIEFTKDDTVLVLGKPWDEPNMTPALADLKLKRGFKLGFIVYDLVIPLYPHLHSPKLFKDYTRYIFEAALAADVLLPISKSTEKDLLKFCDQLSIPKPNTQVVRLGDELEDVKPEKPSGVTIDRNFLICVGTIEVRKNHTLLYYVYKLAKERGINLPQLIIVGRPGWLADDVYNLLRKDKEVAEKITVLESVSDGGLAWLYSNCLFTMYPSMYEGWGLPVAESASYHKVAIASNASSIPEIAGDMFEYFSPYSVDECLHLIQKYLDNSRRSAKQQQLAENYKTTTWYSTTVAIKKALPRHG
jgi:glycosyltransferase involved in cell wall biosynthesis